jgi:hypothetical protein
MCCLLKTTPLHPIPERKEDHAVTSVEKDLDQLTITIVAEFAAPLRRLWAA